LTKKFPVFSGGALVGLGVITSDITERKKVELALKDAKQEAEEKEERFRLLLQNAHDTYVMINEKGEQIYISEAAVKHTGFTIDELLGPIQNVIYPEDLNIVLQAWNEVIADNEKVVRVQYRHKHKYKKFIWYEAVAQNFLHNPAIRAVVVSVRDISIMKETELELINQKNRAEESDQLKTAFLHNLSHEVRTPLNAIVGFSQMLNDEGLSEMKRKEYSSIIQKSTNKLLAVISDILSVSTLETKQEKVFLTEVCINNLIIDLHASFMEEARKKNIEFYFKASLPYKASKIFTDQSKLRQILYNLIANSLKFTEKGHIEIGYKLAEKSINSEHLLSNDSMQSTNFLTFFVKDTGIGIRKESQQRIFERFIQADESIHINFGGTGLGLSISKGFTELLGGKIWVESETGKGATFYFTIPYNKNQTINHALP